MSFEINNRSDISHPVIFSLYRLFTICRSFCYLTDLMYRDAAKTVWFIRVCSFVSIIKGITVYNFITRNF